MPSRATHNRGPPKEIVMLGGFKDAAIKQGMAVLERELSAGVE